MTSNHLDMPRTGAEAEARERQQMGRLSGGLWVVGGLVGICAAFLPGADHSGWIWICGLSALVLAYGVASITNLIPWRHASLSALGIGTATTIPVVGLAIYLSGASISYIEPLLVCSLLYIAFFFPPRLAWVLSGELILVAGAPLLYDDRALQHAYPPRYMATVAGFLAVTWVTLRLKRRLVEAEARQREIAHLDPLTGVGNRRAFDVALERELSTRRKRDGRLSEDAAPLALFVFDLDGFKTINDVHGHQAGDEVLCRTAQRVGEALHPGDTLARIGGDEFAVVASLRRFEDVRELARGIAAAAEAGEEGSAGFPVRASVGWAVFPRDGSDAATLLGVADRRMLRTKASRARGSHVRIARSLAAQPRNGGSFPPPSGRAPTLV